MSVLRGLIGTESLADYRFTNIRRKVFYHYPAGAAPLIGLLSMIKEDVPVNDPKFSHYEERYEDKITESAAFGGGSNGPFGNASSVVLAVGSGYTLSASTEYTIQVDSTDHFRVGHTVRIRNVKAYGVSTTSDLYVLVTAVDTSNLRLKFRPLEAYGAPGVSNENNENIDLELMVMGSAHSEGAASATEGTITIPINPENYTQIWRTPFTFTGTELQTSLKFDKSGIYKDKAKKNSLNHMVEIEKSLIFGRKTTSTNSATNQATRTSGGIYYHLEQYEAANSIYRGGTGAPAITSNANDHKRILDINGSLNKDTFDTYIERCFRITNNEANEKLVICGNGWALQFNKLAEKTAMTQVSMPNNANQFGQSVVGYKTPFGDIYIKTHPLFNINSNLRNDALMLDVGNIAYRPMTNRDTQLRKEIQEKRADFREDEYLTEAGFEVRFPESHMYWRGWTGVDV